MKKWHKILFMVFIAFILSLIALSGKEPQSTVALIGAAIVALFGIFIWVRKKIWAERHKE
jgi:L-asparagine transporter-like permease